MSMSTTPPFPELQTERLVLREIVNADLDEIYKIHSDPDLMKWFGQPLADKAAAAALIDLLASWRELPDPGVRWGLERSDQTGLIGTCGLFLWRRGDRKCTIGYELAHDVQGMGLMQEALRTAISWGFAEMNLRRIEAHIHPDNKPSLALAKRLGFQVEGLLRDAAYWSGKHHDLHILSLLDDEWHANSEVDA